MSEMPMDPLHSEILRRDQQIAAFKALLMEQARQIDKLTEALRFANHRSLN